MKEIRPRNVAQSERRLLAPDLGPLPVAEVRSPMVPPARVEGRPVHPSSSSFAHHVRWQWIGRRSDGAAKIRVDYRILYSLANPDNRLFSCRPRISCYPGDNKSLRSKPLSSGESICCRRSCGQIYLVPADMANFPVPQRKRSHRLGKEQCLAPSLFNASEIVHR
jgi:hypothetical protein